MYKQVAHKGKMWQWPRDDQKLLLVNDWVDDLHKVMAKYRDELGGTAIQAGGACGTWPHAMSGCFHAVYTFEPHPINFTCLVNNVVKNKNVYPMWGALGATRSWATVHLHETEQNNSGAYFTNATCGGDVPVFTIDQFHFDDVTFIQLDVEGNEYRVLLGAEETIDMFEPIVMLETKPLPQMVDHVNAAVDFLKFRGYKITMTLHRDVVMRKS